MTETTLRMADCLNEDDPVKALHELSRQSAESAKQSEQQLQKYIQSLSMNNPSLQFESWDTILGSAESVNVSLTKIASGGSQASQEIRKLELEKLQLEQHAETLETALALRQASDRAAQSVSGSAWHDAADALQVYLNNNNNLDPRITEYAGEYTLSNLKHTYETLKSTVLKQYEDSVQSSNLKSLGSLTPILNALRIEESGLKLYQQYVEGILEAQFDKIVNESIPRDAPPYYKTTKLYNAAVAILRHHLPMVSHCLYKAEGAAALLQQIYVKTEEYVILQLETYQNNKQLVTISQTADDIYQSISEHFDDPDPELSIQLSIGSLADVDHSMEELSKFIQYSESFLKFIRNTATEINKSRRLRYEQEIEKDRKEREKYEWQTGKHKETSMEPYSDLEILPPSTPLSETITELGGYYSVIERCLLISSIQKAFQASNYEDPKYYRALSIVHADGYLQTSLIESIVFLTRRSLQRAFVTLHTFTASSMTNFTVELLNQLADLLMSRAQEYGVQALKPGDGLLLGTNQYSILNAQNLIKKDESMVERLKKQRQVTTHIAQACGIINDLEVAIHHIQNLEGLLNKHIERGFTNAPEALSLCVKNLSSSADVFKMNSTVVVESLESILKPRIRAIVGEAVGSETTNALISMAGATKATEAVVRMNYNLDEETYEMMQLSESYITSLCTSLDDLLEPLKLHLAPRLWDHLLFSIMVTACKRLETSLKKCHFSSLGAIALEHDLRDLLNYIKEKLDQNPSNAVVFQNVPVLAKLLQIANLLTVDNLDDVLDFMKSKTNWEVSSDEAKQYLLAKVEFDETLVQEMFAD